MSVLLSLLGIVLDGLDTMVGVTCSPITVTGVDTGNSCSAEAVCCENNNVVRARFLLEYTPDVADGLCCLCRAV